MLVSVTFNAPLSFETLDAAAAFVSMAGVPAVIEIVADAPAAKPGRKAGAAKPDRKPKAAAPEVTPAEPPATESKPAPAKPGRKPKAAAPEVTPAELKPEPLADNKIERAKVLETFTAAVEVDYDAALALLNKFKVQRFSDLSDEQLPALAAELENLAA